MSKVEDTPENAEICLKNCKQCLTYPGVEGEALFCARGKSSAAPSKKDCNCGICELQGKYGCNSTYYCIYGACE